MQKFGLGVVIALTLAVLAYAGTLAWQDYRAKPVAQSAATRSPQQQAQRERMARLVAAVAAHSAAQTARAAVHERQQAAHATAMLASAIAANK